MTVDPRYGVWVPVQASVFTPLPPSSSDVLNAPANEPGVAPAPASATGRPVQRLTMQRRPHITVVGLGPAGIGLLGDAAAALLTDGGHCFLRTARHPAAGSASRPALLRRPLRVRGDLRRGLRGDRRDAGGGRGRPAPDPVVYAVPGSPLVAERSVELLRADRRVEVTILPALSFLDLAWAALGVDPVAAGVRLVDAASFGSVAVRRARPLPGGPVLVAPTALRGEARRPRRRGPD